MAVTPAKVADRPPFVNYPTLVPGQSSVVLSDCATVDAEYESGDCPTCDSTYRPDYSDGYGGTYAKGE